MKKRWKGLLGLLLAVCLTACSSGGDTFADEPVLKIDQQEIMKSEYMVYLYTTSQSFVAAAGQDVWSMDFDGQTADELVEERTISTLQSVIAAEDYAQANGISLTEEEKEQAKLAAEQFVANVPEEELAKMGVDAEKLAPLMEGSYLYTLVYQSIAAECAVDETEMEAYYQENQAQLEKDYTMLTLQSILLDDQKTAEEVVKKAQNGEDFAELFQAYDIEPDAENGGEVTMQQNQLQATTGLTEEMEAGDVVGPLQMGDGWLVLKATDKKVPTAEEAKELAESIYTSGVQAAYTEARFAEMMKSQTVKKYPDVWETLDKFH